MLPIVDRGRRVARIGAYRVNGGALVIDGEAIGDHGVLIREAAIGPAEPQLGIDDADGVAGGIDLTLEGPDGKAVPGRRECEFELVMDGTVPERIGARLWLAGFNGKYCEVDFSPLGGLVLRGRVSFDDPEDFAMHSEMVMLLDAEPYLLGRERVVYLEGTVKFKADGNAYAWPSFLITPDPGAKSVKVEVDGGQYIEIKSESSSFGGLPVSIETDIDGRECRVGGGLVAPTIESDFWALVPGWRTVKVTGGSGTMSYRERWSL